MKRNEEHRISTKRRALRFMRLMDVLFPPERNHGVPWHHCINLSTMRIDDPLTCPVAQIVGVAGGDFQSACKYAGIELNQRELQHAGILLYNFASDDKRWVLDWAKAEADKLSPAIHAKIAERYLEQPKAVAA